MRFGTCLAVLVVAVALVCGCAEQKSEENCEGTWYRAEGQSLPNTTSRIPDIILVTRRGDGTYAVADITGKSGKTAWPPVFLRREEAYPQYDSERGALVLHSYATDDTSADGLVLYKRSRDRLH